MSRYRAKRLASMVVMGGLASGLLFAQISGAGQASQVQAAQQANAKDSSQSKPYLFALCALKDRGLPSSALFFLTRLPQLILNDLNVLPPRYEDLSYIRKVAAQNALERRFDKGNDLYKKLGDAGGLRYDPSLTNWTRSDRLHAADAAVDKADDALSASIGGIDDSEAGVPIVPEYLPPRTVKAWDGKGLLFNLGNDSPLRAGRKQSIDLVITGWARPVASYVETHIEGWDSAIGEKVFGWSDFASPDDPGPLAKEIAKRIAAWLASTPVARFDLAVKPTSARLLVDGKPVDSSELVLFSPENRAVSIDAWAPGFGAQRKDILLVDGESRGLTLDLKPESYGSVQPRLDPPFASLLIGGLVVDPTKAIGLGGLKDILIASAPGYETKMQVLPAQGFGNIDVKLRKSDGLGPGKRTDRAKDGFYLALGLVAIGFPVASLAQGYQNMYLEANFRRTTGFTKEYATATTVYWTAVAGTVAAAAWTVSKLVVLLGGMGQE